jgi:hypothetical protein
MDPDVAVEIIEERIYKAIEACDRAGLCQDETDFFIIAALAQNGLLPHGWLQVSGLPRSADGSVDWEEVMDEQGRVGFDNSQWLRQEITGMNFNTKFQLALFTENVFSLLSNSFMLSEDFNDVNWTTINGLLR